jgi:hypothetical protein
MIVTSIFTVAQSSRADGIILMAEAGEHNHVTWGDSRLLERKYVLLVGIN